MVGAVGDYGNQLRASCSQANLVREVPQFYVSL